MLNSYFVSLPKVDEEQWTFALQFYLDNNGLPSLDKASINSIYYEDAPATTNPPTTTQTEEKKDAPQPEKKAEKVKKEKHNTCIIKLVENNFGLPQDYLNAIIQREATQENDDRLLTLAINKRNEIENFIYSTRGRLDGELVEYVTPEDRENLLNLMNEMEQWLYSGSEDVYVKSILDERVKNLNELGNRIYKRYHDWERLADSLKRLQEKVAQNQTIANDVNQNSFLNQFERDELRTLVQKNIEYLNEGMSKFQQSTRKADAPISYEQVDKLVDEFSNVKFC